MKASVILADYGRVANGKLDLIGGGWSVIGPKVGAHAVAIKVEVPWSEANDPHSFRLELLGEDGSPVEVPQADDGPKPLRMEGRFETGRPPGLAHGTPLDWVFALQVPPLPLLPGRYEWRLTVDDHSDEHTRAAFTVRDRPPLRIAG